MCVPSVFTVTVAVLPVTATVIPSNVYIIWITPDFVLSVSPSFIVTVISPLLYQLFCPFGVAGFIVIVGVSILPLVVPVIPVPVFTFPARSTASTITLYVTFGSNPVTSNLPSVVFFSSFTTVLPCIT